MTLAELNTALTGITGVAHCYGFFPENQEAPYIAYSAETLNPIYSDGQLVYGEETVTLVLVTRYRDLASESTLDALFATHGVQYSKTMEVDGEQKTHSVTYTFTVQ